MSQQPTTGGRWWFEGTFHIVHRTATRPMLFSLKDRRLRVALPVRALYVLAVALLAWAPPVREMLLKLLAPYV